MREKDLCWNLSSWIDESICVVWVWESVCMCVHVCACVHVYVYLHACVRACMRALEDCYARKAQLKTLLRILERFFRKSHCARIIVYELKKTAFLQTNKLAVCKWNLRRCLQRERLILLIRRVDNMYKNRTYLYCIQIPNTPLSPKESRRGYTTISSPTEWRQSSQTNWLYLHVAPCRIILTCKNTSMTISMATADELLSTDKFAAK